uniref:Uncharacterized protein n=1 Tax=Zosterops lateralis melanops TaxID=1220523 RepID=A0A8D2NXS6_ZOSLA
MNIVCTQFLISALCFCPTGNTVSNLIFILPPIYGAIQTYKDGLEKRYLAAYLCLTGMCKT